MSDKILDFIAALLCGAVLTALALAYFDVLCK
jgi:hypothetical protein